MTSVALDKYDFGLLDTLQKEDGASLSRLAEKINLSVSQCSRRLARLKSAGYIQRQITLLNPASLGLDVAAFVTVTIAKHNKDSSFQFESSVLNFPQVLECHAIAGDGDYLLKVVAPNSRTLTEFIMKELLALTIVTNLKTTLSLASIKSTTALPL